MALRELYALAWSRNDADDERVQISGGLSSELGAVLQQRPAHALNVRAKCQDEGVAAIRRLKTVAIIRIALLM